MASTSRFIGIALTTALSALVLTGCPTDSDNTANVGDILNGSTLWARAVGGGYLDRGTSITALPGGGCTATGYFSSTASFDDGKALETTLTSTGLKDVLLVSYDDDGDFEWAKKAGGTGDDWGTAIASCDDGDLVVTGYYSGRAVFGDGETYRTVLNSEGEEDIFIARFKSNGTLEWAKSAGAEGSDKGLCIAALSDGSCIVAGFLYGECGIWGGDLDGEDLAAIRGNGNIRGQIQLAGGLGLGKMGGRSKHGRRLWGERHGR